MTSGLSPDGVNTPEAALKQAGKNYEFHRYDAAGHAFFAAYRPSTASGRRWMDGRRQLHFLGNT